MEVTYISLCHTIDLLKLDVPQHYQVMQWDLIDWWSFTSLSYCLMILAIVPLKSCGGPFQEFPSWCPRQEMKVYGHLRKMYSMGQEIRLPGDSTNCHKSGLTVSMLFTLYHFNYMWNPEIPLYLLSVNNDAHLLYSCQVSCSSFWA